MKDPFQQYPLAWE